MNRTTRPILPLAAALALLALAPGCISHKVTLEQSQPIDVNLHIMLDDRLQNFFDYQAQAAANPPPAPTATAPASGSDPDSSGQSS